MNRLFLLIVSVLVIAASAKADRGNFINYAVLTLPPKYLADIPMSERTDLLRELSYLADDTRLDYANGYLEYYSDSPEPPNASSMFYLKVLPTDNPFDCPILVHMQKPYNGTKPSADQTFVLERSSDGWTDITKDVLPKNIDRKSHFRPMRRSLDVEVAPWIRKGSWGAYSYGLCDTILRWNGKRFEVIKIEKRKLTENNP